MVEEVTHSICCLQSLYERKSKREIFSASTNFAIPALSFFVRGVGLEPTLPFGNLNVTQK